MVLMAEFYLDHNVSAELARLLRATNHTVIAARDIQFKHAKDDLHLLVASQRGWILVSHNEGDFVLLRDAWRRWSAAWGVAEPHAGIAIVPQFPRATSSQVAQALDELINMRPSLTNELHFWRPTSGWHRHP
jgi:hypothetical protein